MPNKSTFAIYEPRLAVPLVEIPDDIAKDAFAVVAPKFSKIAGGMRERLKAQAAAWLQETLPAFKSEVAQHLMEADGADDVGSGYAQRFADAFNKRVEDLRKQVPAYGDAAFENFVALLQHEIHGAVRQIDERGEQRARSNAVGGALDHQASVVNSGVIDPVDAVAESHAIVNAAKLPPEQHQTAMRRIDEMAADHLVNKIERDPSGAVALMESDNAHSLIGDRWLRSQILNSARASARHSKVDEVVRTNVGKHATVAALQHAIVRDAQDGKLPLASLKQLRTLDPQQRRAVGHTMAGARERVAERQRHIEVVAGVLERGEKPNPNDPLHRKGVDALFEGHVKIERDRLTPERWHAIAGDFIARTGVVPKTLGQDVARALHSDDPVTLADAADLVWSLGNVMDKVWSFLDAGNRRTLDLIFGQKLLGELTENAARKVLDRRLANGEVRSLLERPTDGADLEHALTSVFDWFDSNQPSRSQELDTEPPIFDPSRPPLLDQARPYDGDVAADIVPLAESRRQDYALPAPDRTRAQE